MSFCRVPMRNLSNGCPLVLLLRDSDTKRSSVRLCEWVVPGCDCVNHTCCVLLLLGVCAWQARPQGGEHPLFYSQRPQQEEAD